MENGKCRKIKNKGLAIFCMLLLLVMAGVACTKKVSYVELVKEELESIFPASALKGYCCIVLIPNGGCAGCVQQAENYFQQQQGNMETLFVFTNFSSRKSLTIKLGKESLARPNVWLDNDNRLYFPECAESIYPCVIFLKEGLVDYFVNLDVLLSE